VIQGKFSPDSPQIFYAEKLIYQNPDAGAPRPEYKLSLHSNLERRKGDVINPVE
jgi:hypothetical protein